MAAGVRSLSMHVSEIWRYPVKSMVGESVATGELDDLGIAGDRWWATRDLDKGGIKGAKKLGGLMRCRAAAIGATGGDVSITLPNGSSVLTTDPDVHDRVSAAIGAHVRLERLRPASDLDHYRPGAPDSGDMVTEIRAIMGREGDEPLPDFSIFPPAVFEFTLDAGKLEARRTLSVVEPGQQTAKDFVGDVAVSPDGATLLATNIFRDSIVSINRATGKVTSVFHSGRRPYRLLFHPDGQTFFASSWADGTVTRYRTNDGSSVTSVRVGPHTTDMVYMPGDPARLFVTASNTNNTYVIGVPPDGEMTHIETLNLGLSPLQPVGMTPSALALSANQRTLYVVCSDANAVAVIDLTSERSTVMGFIPAGWYPTAVRELPDGYRWHTFVRLGAMDTLAR